MIDVPDRFSVDPMHIQPGDVVIVPLADNDATVRELSDYARKLKAACPGVDFVLIAPSPMTHAIAYRPTPKPEARELCGATWHHPGVEHENHRCKHEREKHPNHHYCRCGSTMPASTTQALPGEKM